MLPVDLVDHQRRVAVDFEPSDFAGHRHSQPSDDNFVLGLIVCGSEAECEGLFDDRTPGDGDLVAEDGSDFFSLNGMTL